jgi:hypothetical protein
MTAITTQFRGREELIQGDKIPPMPFSLVLKLPEEFGKRRIAEMFGECVILEHPGDIQSFDMVSRSQIDNVTKRQYLKFDLTKPIKHLRAGRRPKAL